MLVLTKYQRGQNVAVDKTYASTKCWRRQHISVDKMLASTKCWHRQNVGVDKILVATKCWRRKKWCRHRRIPLLFGLAESAAAGFSRAAGPAEDLLRLPDGVALFACSRQVRHCLQPSCFFGWTLSCTVPNVQNFGAWQNIGARLKFTDFCQTMAVYISAHRRPIKKRKKHKCSL